MGSECVRALAITRSFAFFLDGISYFIHIYILLLLFVCFSLARWFRWIRWLRSISSIRALTHKNRNIYINLVGGEKRERAL